MELYRIVTCVAMLISVVLLGLAFSKVNDKNGSGLSKLSMLKRRLGRKARSEICQEARQSCTGVGQETGGCCAGLKCDNGECVSA